jgi:hypothetical protein
MFNALTAEFIAGRWRRAAVRNRRVARKCGIVVETSRTRLNINGDNSFPLSGRGIDTFKRREVRWMGHFLKFVIGAGTAANFTTTWGDPMKICAMFLILLGLGLGCVSRANADCTTVPCMTIKIFNDDPNGNYIFPVLTTGQGGLKADVWLQAFFMVPNSQIGTITYRKQKSYRIYVSSSNIPQGIPPGKTVWITVPLYTQLVASPTSPFDNQYIDWWNGGTIQLFASPTSDPPRALTDDLTNRSQCMPNPCQNPLGTVYSDLPSCNNNNGDPNNICPGFQFFIDTADLPKNDPAQLLEYTLGARVAQVVVNDSPPNTLDLKNVDFDVSYVNLAYGPAAMGPVGNDQVGYVGTPQTLATFATALKQFVTDFTIAGSPWPQFLRSYPTAPTSETILKIPSPLEIFDRLGPVDIKGIPSDTRV